MKKDNIKLSIFWVFSFIVIIFMMTFTSHAEETYDLPYVVELWDNNFTFYTDTSLDVAVAYYYSDLYPNASEVLVFTTDGFLGSGAIQYLFIGDPYINYDVPSDLDYTTTGITISSPYPVFRVGVYSDGRMSGTSSQGYQYASLFGISSVVTTANGNYIPRYPFYYDGEGIYDTNDDLIIIQDFPITPIDIGAAVLPGVFQDPIFQNGQTPPSQVPEITINNYSWTTAPTPDFSTLEDTANSIYDLVKWLGDNLKAELSNLVQNIENLGKYIGETIQYYGGMIIKEIQNGIQTFYNNMVSLVQPIFEKIDYITTPLEVDVIWDNISTTSLVTNISTIQTSLTSFQGAFTGVAEPNEYKIPIHFENLPSTWFGNQTTQYIDLGIINGTVKDGLRLFVWAMVTYGLVVTIFDSIANYINGGGDES